MQEREREDEWRDGVQRTRVRERRHKAKEKVEKTEEKRR